MAQGEPIDVFGEVSEGTVTFAADSGIDVVEISLADYNALQAKDSNTLYLITS